MIAFDATRRDIDYVLSHLRAHNVRELAAVRWNASPAAIAAEYVALEPCCIKHFAFFHDDAQAPIALAGAWLATPAVALVRMAATDEWPTIAHGVYRWFRRVFIPCVLEPNVLRAETRVLDTGAVSRRWLHRLGFREEGIARSFGRAGEDYVHMAWINPGGVACVSSLAGCSAAEVPRSYSA